VVSVTVAVALAGWPVILMGWPAGGRGRSGRGQQASSRRSAVQVRWLGVVTGVSAASTMGFLVMAKTHGTFWTP